MELEPLEVDARSSGDDARVKAPSPRWTRPPDARARAENATPRVADIASRVVLRWARADCPRREAALEAGPRGGRDVAAAAPKGSARTRIAPTRTREVDCRALSSFRVSAHERYGTINRRDDRCCCFEPDLSARAAGSGEPAMSEADGALAHLLDDLQARLSRVAALSAPVDVAVGSVRSSPARALKKRAAHSPRPTSLVSPLASPALEGRAAYYQTRDVVPGRASDDTKSPPDTSRGLGHEERIPVAPRDASSRDASRTYDRKAFFFRRRPGRPPRASPPSRPTSSSTNRAKRKREKPTVTTALTETILVGFDRDRHRTTQLS